MTEDDVRALLHELRDEPVPADSLARVRMAVAERTRVERRIPWLVWDWKRLAMLAAAIAVAVAAMLFRPGHRSIPPDGRGFEMRLRRFRRLRLRY